MAKNKPQGKAKDAAAAPNTSAQAHDVSATVAGQPATRALSVTAKVDGFRRAGRAWAKTETIVPLHELADEHVDQIMSDPMLIAKHVDAN